MPGALVLLDTTHREEKNLVNKFQKFKNIVEAHVTYGDYDILLKIETDSLNDIKEINSKIRSESDVNLTQTFLYSEESKKIDKGGNETWDSEKLNEKTEK